MNTRHRAYPNDHLVMRPSEKFEAKAAGQKGSEAWSSHVENIFGRQRRHRALQPDAIERVIWICSTNVENVRQITSFYAKQSQFYAFMTWKQWFHEKTKPIQSQFKANLSQNKPNLSQFQSQTNPIVETTLTGGRIRKYGKKAKNSELLLLYQFFYSFWGYAGIVWFYLN